ncbi:MAG: 50S ribosomal protein L7/L12 [Anaerolineaceae bacterium]|nr:50S ribosomal protein L7/L12 [Anaerolineaceae bacterium]MCD6475745.1 50S ribosomal protein L7/L12 [Anaerolineaceae bacterium]
MADLKKLVEELSELTVLEAADLVKELEEKWGVSAAAPVAAVAVAAAAEEEVEEKTEWDVIIKGPGPKKIETIKVIRQLTSLGLVDAKNMAEEAGAKVLTGVAKEVAEEAKEKLTTAGAEVEIA